MTSTKRVMKKVMMKGPIKLRMMSMSSFFIKLPCCLVQTYTINCEKYGK
jgi:hypothetical protein